MYYNIRVFKTNKNEMGWASSIRMEEGKFVPDQNIKI
jgi:hypothetical protein